jgi:hypothetical protein
MPCASRLRSAGTSANQRACTRAAIGSRSPAREQFENRPHVAPSAQQQSRVRRSQAISSAGQPGKYQPKGTSRATAHSGRCPHHATAAAAPSRPRRPAPVARHAASPQCSRPQPQLPGSIISRSVCNPEACWRALAPLYRNPLRKQRRSSFRLLRRHRGAGPRSATRMAKKSVTGSRARRPRGTRGGTQGDQ